MNFNITICISESDESCCVRSIGLQCELKKGNPGLTPNFSKSKKKTIITKLISVHHSIIILLSLNIVHLYSVMDGCTAINFVKHVKTVFVHVGVVCAAWWHMRELSQPSNNSCIRTALCKKKKNWTKTVLTCFTKKNDCWAAIPDPTWTTNVPYEREINMLSSII